MGIKRKISAIVVLLCVLVVFMACDRVKSESKDGFSDIRSEERIVFIQQFTNYSDTYVNKGYFIVSNGDKVFYDLSDEEIKYGGVDELLILLNALERSNSEENIGIKNLTKYCKWLEKIDLDYSMEEVSHGADQGSKCLYGIQYDKEQNPIVILLEETGDWDRKNTDKYAVKIVKEMND